VSTCCKNTICVFAANVGVNFVEGVGAVVGVI
jgi:hypothetical protein